MPPTKKDLRRTLRSLYVWHRWIGIGCALLVVWLAVTGILLNHSSRLGLDRSYVQAPWLFRVYGIRPQPPGQGIPVAGRWIVQAGDLLFLDSKPVAEWHAPLIGATSLAGVILVAAPHTALLLTPEGEVIESLTGAALPGEVLGVASTEQHLLLRTADGIYAMDTERLEFERYAGEWPMVTGGAQPLPAVVAQEIVARGAGIRLSRERLLSDLHSGRLLGRYGPLIMDLASIGFIFLALTGLWLWWRHRRIQRLRMRQRPH
jgi:hypothetical protein